jgi:CheY-like chemotaxis protein
MTARDAPIIILVADDDPEDQLLIKDAFAVRGLTTKLRFVDDGEELIDYLTHRGRYADPASAPRPGLILLDLNMPRKDGREALKEIKADATLRHIPIVVLTTSNAEQDIYQCYDLGANSFLTKPDSFKNLADVMQMLSQYWLEAVTLPIP